MAADDLTQRTAEDLAVEAKGPVVDVPDVQRELVVPRERVAAVDLRPARDPRPHLVPPLLLGCVEIEVLHQQRARADEAHLAREHVEQLRELVEARAPEEPPERGESRRVGQQLTAAIAGVGHGAELHERERHSVASRAQLSEHHRRAHAHADGDRNGREHG